jgi:rod shape-determining protein MreC
VVKTPLTPAAVLGARRRTGPLLVTALLGHLILVSTQVTTGAGRTFFDAMVFGVMGTLQRMTASFSGTLSASWQRYVALWDVEGENVRLKAQVSQLEVRLQEQRALALRGERLEALLGLQQRVLQRTLVAEVVAGDASPWFRTVTINRGTSDGVEADMAVVSPRGVVGRVIDRPSAHAARVQLLVDRSAAAGALIERSRAGGVATGDDGIGLRMDYVSNLADVQAGDLVVTSGLDGIYPRGFIIGEVTASERGPGLYRRVSVRPAVDFSAVEEVLVVLDPPASSEAAAAAGPGAG